jgi:hypothetical protein
LIWPIRVSGSAIFFFKEKDSRLLRSPQDFSENAGVQGGKDLSKFWERSMRW